MRVRLYPKRNARVPCPSTNFVVIQSESVAKVMEQDVPTILRAVVVCDIGQAVVQYRMSSLLLQGTGMLLRKT